MKKKQNKMSIATGFDGGHGKKCKEMCKEYKEKFPASRLLETGNIPAALVALSGNTLSCDALYDCWLLIDELAKHYRQNDAFASALDSILEGKAKYGFTDTAGARLEAMSIFFSLIDNAYVRGFIESQRLEDPSLFNKDDLDFLEAKIGNSDYSNSDAPF